MALMAPRLAREACLVEHPDLALTNGLETRFAFLLGVGQHRPWHLTELAVLRVLVCHTPVGSPGPDLGTDTEPECTEATGHARTHAYFAKAAGYDPRGGLPP